MSEKVQIDKHLFINIVKIICLKIADEKLQEETAEQLNKKLSSIIERELYSKYKTAIFEEEREEYKRKYIEERSKKQ